MNTRAFLFASAAAICVAGSPTTVAAYAQTAASGSASAENSQSTAQANAAENAVAGDIIVTAQKRSERLRDVPLSITAATGEQLASQGITTPSDLVKITPGFAFQKTAFGVPVYTLRGVGLFDNFLGVSPTVTVYVDQVPLPFLAMTQAAGLDPERVEVLKGPQGTLFGQNSTGGAINYIAAKPTDTFEGALDLTYGRFNQVEGQLVLSGPISETLRARVAVRHESRGNWQYSVSRPGDGLGQRDYTAARLLLEWEPRDGINLQLNANAWWDRSDTQAGQFFRFREAVPSTDDIPPEARGYPEARLAIGNLARTPFKARAADWDADKSYRRDDKFKQVSLRGDIDLTDDITLTSLTSYIDFKLFSPNDNDGTPFQNYFGILVGTTQSFYQELRVAGELSDRLRFTVGANYGFDDVKGNSLGRIISSNSGIGPFRFFSFGQQADQKVRTLAGFAAVDYEITDKLTVQVSGRYTDQRRKFAGCLQDGGDGRASAAGDFLQTVLSGVSDPAPPGGCITLDIATGRRLDIFKDQLNENNFSWRGSLNWKPTDNTLLYANVTKGYKSGTFTTVPAITTEQIVPVPQESVLAYEAGFKTSLAQNRVELSGAAFYYDYRDKQLLGFVQTIFGFQTGLTSIPESNIKGAEVSLLLRPLTGLTFNLGGTYVDSEVTRERPPTVDPLGRIISIEGDRFPNTPKWQFVADAQYDFPIGEGVDAFVGGSATTRSSSQGAIGRVDGFTLTPYVLLDARAGVELQDGRVRIEIWGRNITNKYYIIGVYQGNDSTNRLTGLPATYGATVRTRF